ncbi:ATP-dependent DNA helicase 2 subunit 1 isoform X2 [Rhagoletis pomonella]|uniref:ATP-dependent DNA helicase 2 subunit 1 isoform X1 n=1 Tax=Rhagoletis pomonella TaxID=28610 RepID=UPI00177FCF9C|nr:ATP-dependent DNA helicase 2 subunit 1 isoform X1 [Rhagoletis pomonella]XP_036329290.1 ATP-dependent DNA helicase 2 subunit 1 isoform X2 [Rhagoletis pomonella]
MASTSSSSTTTHWNPNYDVLISDSEDDDDETKPNYKGREALIFVLDANLYEEYERFSEALDIVRKALISGLLVNSKDLIGIVFANTAKNTDPYEASSLDNIVVPQNCAVFLPLRELSKSIVEHYLRFMETVEQEFGADYGIVGNGGNSDFSAMLRLCINLFENAGYNLVSSTLVYLTDRATPHPKTSNLYQRALQKAKDLEGKEIEFQVVPMIDEFDYEPFYKEFLTLVEDGDIDAFEPRNPEELRVLLSDRKLRQNVLRRSLGRFKFSLGPDLLVSVQYYNYFKARFMPRKVRLLRKDNSIVQQKRVIMVRKQSQETMDIVEEQQVKQSGGWYEINLGEMSIRITPEQINRVRNLHAPGMMLLGFKPISDLPENWYYKPQNFMYPDDKNISGSKRLFRALWERCLIREKMAICLFMRKRKSIPRYVALVPVEAGDSEGNTSRALLSGDGFKIIYLPFAKHIRDIDFANWNSMQNEAPEEGVQVFTKVVGKLRTEFQSNSLVDPTVEALQSNILALALDIKTDNAGLSGMPDTKRQDERIAKILPRLNEIFGEDAEVVKKRGAADSSGGNAPKVPKVDVDHLKDIIYIKQLANNDTLSSCTIAQLRDILKSHFDVKAPSHWKKQDLIERVKNLIV